MEPTWGPPGSCRPQMGPMLTPWILLSGKPLKAGEIETKACLRWCAANVLAPIGMNLKRHMMTSSNRNIFRLTGPLCGEFTGHRWICLTRGSDAELWCFLWFAPWINGRINNREAGNLRRHHAHYDVIAMIDQLGSATQIFYRYKNCGNRENRKPAVFSSSITT